MAADLAPQSISRSTEDYLKAIYRLSSDETAASTNDIAAMLDLAPASVSGMIKRLSEQGLVEHVPYRGVSLTGDGRRIALRMVRRHRLIEAYLVGFLGYSWDAVHDEAERLEHAVSETLVERMAEALGNPRFDPHGDPIPDPDGSIAEVIHVPLTDFEPGQTATIRRVDTRDDGRLRFLAGEGLVPGTEVTVIDQQPFRGPLILEVGSEQRVLGHELAAILLCSREDA